MANPNSALAPPADEQPMGARELDKIERLLTRAAELAAEQGLDTEVFMNAAWEACLESRPGLREKLVDKELKAQLRKLRKKGLIGQA
jgi:hypothetical protein